MDIQLTFRNQSKVNSSNIVIYQQNMASRAGNFAIAWRVIEDSTPGSIYPFVFSPNLTVNTSDSFGNFTAPLAAQNGQLFQVNEKQFAYVGPTVNKANIQVRNGMPVHNINAYLYRNDLLLANKIGIAAGQKAVFQFTPAIWIGIMPQIMQGDVINATVMQEINTELSLAGLASADIIMTGGGSGTSTLPIQFELANTVWA